MTYGRSRSSTRRTIDRQCGGETYGGKLHPGPLFFAILALMLSHVGGTNVTSIEVPPESLNEPFATESYRQLRRSVEKYDHVEVLETFETVCILGFLIKITDNIRRQ